MPLNKGLDKVVYLSLIGLAAQGIVLVQLADVGNPLALCGLLALPLIGAMAVGTKTLRSHRGIAHLAVVAGLGGLAMIAGQWLDGGGAGSHHAGHGVSTFWNWSTAGMVMVCVLGGYSVHRCSGGGSSLGRPCDLVGHVGMLAGMALGGAWLAGPLLSSFDSMLVAHHLAMVLGMTLGALIGQQSVRLFDAAVSMASAATSGGP